MNEPIPIDRQEREPSTMLVIQPTTDLLLKKETGNLPLSPEILADLDLERQAGRRRELSQELTELFEQIPDPSLDIEEALNQDLISPEQLVQVYDNLSDFLNSDENNARLILYIPFELVPRKVAQETPEILRESEERFRSVYLKNWQKLLSEEDVRANFVDGEILEQELRSGLPPMVAKAAHLIPQLVKKGLISIADVEKLAQDAESDTLYESILDSIPVLADLDLISQDHHLVQEALRTRPEKTIKDEKTQNIDDVLSSFYRELDGLDEWHQKRQNEPGVTKARADWEKIDRRQKIIAQMAAKISQGIEGDVSIEGMAHQERLEAKLALIMGVREAVEAIATQDLEAAKTKAKSYEELLLSLWQEDNKEIKDALTTTWAHWTELNIIDRQLLQNLDIEIPNMETPFPIDDEIKNLEPIIEGIKNDPELAQKLYPVILLYGSRLKGYADRSADLDIALFVRPRTDIKERDSILERVRNLFPNQEEVAKIVEFYLEKKDANLQVREDLPDARTVAERDWAHVLFGGVWVGDNEELRALYARLMPGYFETANQPFYQDYDNRAHWLREIEREVLQYRLMHRGYERYSPRRDGVDSEHSEAIDSQSVFYDPGFRRLATKLFINKVFFPKLE